jgi:hypothetical protein
LANNKIQIKRTSVSGRTANVTSSGNSQFIDAGEFALNMTDGILYTSNGSTLITVGSNLVNQNITGTLAVDSISSNVSFTSTGAVKLPVGTQLQRPTGVAGQLRFNSNTAQFEGYNGSLWGAIGGASEWISVVSNYTASSGDAIIADTSAGTFTITLPATPAEGDYIIILDGDDWSTTNLTVARNGSTIDSLAENLIVDVGKIKIEFVYDGTTWKVYTNIGQVGVDETISLLGRTITGTADQIVVTNGNGDAGNPVISAVVASQAEAVIGTDNTKLMTPLRAAQARIDPENRVINGAFDFWQRGTSSTASGYVAADRWSNSFSGGTVTISRQSFTLGDTLGSNSPTYFFRQTVSGQTLSTQYGQIYQNIESVRSYAGQTITVLGWARRSSGTGNMAVEGFQSFGTGGSPSSIVLGISPATVTLTGSFAPFAVTMNVPSITGKTLGTNNNDSFGLLFWTSAGSDYNVRSNSLGLQTIGVDLWGIHIKVGTHTTDAVSLYRQPELGPELARCQRYFELFGQAGVGRVASATICDMSFSFSVPKRATPTIAFVNNAVAQITESTVSVRTATSISVQYPGNYNGVLLSLNVSGGGMTSPNMILAYPSLVPNGFLSASSEL